MRYNPISNTTSAEGWEAVFYIDDEYVTEPLIGWVLCATRDEDADYDNEIVGICRNPATSSLLLTKDGPDFIGYKRTSETMECYLELIGAGDEDEGGEK